MNSNNYHTGKLFSKLSSRGGGAGGAIAPSNISVGKQRSPNFSQAIFCIEQPKSVIYACCKELTVNANLLQSEFAQSRQQSLLQHEKPF